MNGCRPRSPTAPPHRGWTRHHYYGAAQLSFVAWGATPAVAASVPEGRGAESGRSALGPLPVGLRARGDHGRAWDAALRRRVDPRNRRGCWASVGDRGTVPADGRVIVAGRDDVIVTGGATVAPSATSKPPWPVAAAGAIRGRASRTTGSDQCVAAVCTDAGDLPRLPAAARALARCRGTRRAVGCISPTCRSPRPESWTGGAGRLGGSTVSESRPAALGVAIVAARRSPIGTAGHGLAGVERSRTRGGVLRAVADDLTGTRAPAGPYRPGPAGQLIGPGGNLARVAALSAGLPRTCRG